MKTTTGSSDKDRGGGIKGLHVRAECQWKNFPQLHSKIENIAWRRGSVANSRWQTEREKLFSPWCHHGWLSAPLESARLDKRQITVTRWLISLICAVSLRICATTLDRWAKAESTSTWRSSKLASWKRFSLLNLQAALWINNNDKIFVVRT